jgi:tetratricopeptide (TPR) repeat protein
MQDAPEGPLMKARETIAYALGGGEWSQTASDLEGLELEAQRRGPDYYTVSTWVTQVHPWRALALAKAGRLAESRTLVASTPMDCYPCLRARGLVETVAGDFAAAERWFREATKVAPSLPFAYRELAEAALAQSDIASAKETADQARRLGPNWADAALTSARVNIAAGRCDQASLDIKRAEEIAPKWLGARRSLSRCEAASRLRTPGG